MSLHRRKPSTIGCFLRSFFFITIIAFLSYILVKYSSNGGSTVISPLPEESAPDTSIFRFMKTQKDPEALREKVKSIIGNEWNNYSVYVCDINSKFVMGINESTIYTAASINKIPILAALYADAAKGKVDFDKVITLQAEDIQDYGTGSIRYDNPGTTYSVKTLAKLMMQKSDNTAAFLLANYIIGLDSVQSYVNSLGLTQTDMVNNKTSNKDMWLLMNAIYQKNVTTKALSEEMLGFMTDSDFEDRLPALLPKGVTVYHKIGTGTGAVHDVGVVTHGKNAYYIGIFTSDITDEEQASKLLAEVSKIVFDFMDRN